MVTHITVRMAWHDSGWNGHICQNPRGNVYCVGRHSFPNEVIPNERNVEWEQKNRGASANTLDNLLPCAWSVNAFGRETIKGFSRPPVWFRDGTSIKQWDIPPATIAIWPYEEVYKEEAKNAAGSGPVWDPVKRREGVNNFFNQITNRKSLIFYYANYSNPFSEGDSQKYVVIGVSRVLEVGAEVVWDDQSKRMEERYGPNVWARNIRSNYPVEGFRIPYHQYMDNPEILDRLLFVPEDSRLFKYATRHLTDDDALGVIEKFIAVVDVLIEIGDDSEDWQARRTWLTSVMAELWHSRGLYPGLLRVMGYLGFQDAIDYAKKRFDTNPHEEQTVKEDLFAILNAKQDTLTGLGISSVSLSKLRQRWSRLGSEVQSLLQNILIRFDLKLEQIKFIIDEPAKVNVITSHADIIANPYVLTEQYVGGDADDRISFSRIDRGVFPSPELGKSLDLELDSWQRLRALAVQVLRGASQHTYLPLQQVIKGVNDGLSHLPERRQFKFKPQDFEMYQRDLDLALHFRTQGNSTFVYLRNHYEDERLVEETLRELALRPQLKLRNPVPASFWKNALKEAGSPLNEVGSEQYEEILLKQTEVCQRIFPKALTVICGAAGTGKTTIIDAIIKSIENAHGTSAVFKLLAPTGKAADRLRERTKKDAQTIHSFLANGWLNTHNMTFQRTGGRKQEQYTTYIIDEASMLDLSLLATFFRSVNWNSVQRLILVGDPNQLPPIGTGRVFADLVDWLRADFPDHVGQLTINVRQIVNKIQKRGTGIVDVASTYTRLNPQPTKIAKEEADRERILEKLWYGHEVDGDLRVEYWANPEELERLLMGILIQDMENISDTPFDSQKPYELWNNAMKDTNGQFDAHALQILSPYRGELFGIEHLNTIIQQHKNAASIKSIGQIGGITSHDKVIQNRNEKREAWDRNSRQKTKETVYNGEIGFATLQTKEGRFLNISFKRREHLSFGYTSNNDVLDNLELAYAISVHKSQGSEFEHVYFIVPRSKRALLSRELFYTGLTRARKKCTLLVEGDVTTLLSLQRPESSHLSYVNASLFSFLPVPDTYLELQRRRMQPDYIDGPIPDVSMVDRLCRYPSDGQIACLLMEQDIPFDYQVPIMDDAQGIFLLPTFTVKFRGTHYYWEHIGLVTDHETELFWEIKLQNYQRLGLTDQLIISKESDLADSYLEEKLRELFTL